MPLPQSRGEKSNNNIFNQMAVDQAVMLNKLTNVEKKVDDIDGKLNSEYATKEWCKSEFGQTTKLVNAFLGILGVALVGALAAWIISGGLKQ